jgi:hypothetical protein
MTDQMQYHSQQSRDKGTRCSFEGEVRYVTVKIGGECEVQQREVHEIPEQEKKIVVIDCPPSKVKPTESDTCPSGPICPPGPTCPPCPPKVRFGGLKDDLEKQKKVKAEPPPPRVERHPSHSLHEDPKVKVFVRSPDPHGLSIDPVVKVSERKDNEHGLSRDPIVKVAERLENEHPLSADPKTEIPRSVTPPWCNSDNPIINTLPPV